MTTESIFKVNKIIFEQIREPNSFLEKKFKEVCENANSPSINLSS